MAKARADLVSDALSNLGIVILTDGAATRTRAELVTEVFANYGFNYQADASATRTRLEWATETLANLGVVQQAFAGATRTRADLVTEAMAKFGAVYQADASATRTRADWVTETLQLLGITQQTDASATRTRADWVNETLHMLGIVQQTDASATKTRADLVNNIAFILGPGAAGQALSADDYSAIDIRIDTIVGDLNARAIANVSNLAAIPGAWFDALSVIVANVCKEKYGVSGDEAVKLQAEAVLAENKLKTLTRTGLVDEILPQIIGDLNARGIASVANIAAIPGAWLPALADIAAEFVKGKFDVAPERSLQLVERARAAEQKLRTLSAPALVDEALPSLVGELNARGIATVANIAAIPGAWFTSLADIAAEYCKGKVGSVAPERSQELSARAREAERKLKILTRAPLVDEKVDAVMADLVGRLVVTVTVPVVTVPTQYFAPLATILADSCKDKFEVAADLAARLAAEAQKAERDLKVTSRLSIVDEMLPSIIGDLNARAVATVASIAAIPGAWFASLADIAAEQCKGKFEIAPERSIELAARAVTAERKLKVITQAPLVDEKIPAIVGELNARGIVTIADLAAIPGAYFSSLADIVAESCRGKFEVAADIAVRVAARAQAAERALKNLTRSYLVDRNIDPILADLAARNVVYLVDQSDIPDEWYFHLAAIVADRCKGKFELDPMTLQRVSSDGAQALMDLRELTRGRPSYLPQQTSYF